MTTITESIKSAFDTFYAANFTDADTLQDLIFGPECDTAPEYRESVTKDGEGNPLTRERIYEMWEVMRYLPSTPDRARAAYQKFRKLALLAQFSTLADELVAEGYFVDGGAQ